MRNIKYCPKCNNSTTAEEMQFCPFDGTALIEMQPAQRQSLPQQNTIQPPISQPLASQPPAVRKQNWKTHIFVLLVLVPIGACCLLSTVNSSKDSVNNGTNSNQSLNTTTQVSTNQESSTNYSPQVKATPKDPTLEKVGNQAYKIGLQNGGNRPSYITEDTEVKNTAQVGILAETAADLVYKPKPEYRRAWVFRFTQGFITGYNKRRPNAPIRNMLGDVVDENHQ